MADRNSSQLKSAGPAPSTPVAAFSGTPRRFFTCGDNLPGLRAALGMLTASKADATAVAKLDRITRSVKDLGHLCDTYFHEGLPFYLLSVSDAIDTRSADGKLILNVLMSVAQWEREAISERTYEALNELRRQVFTWVSRPTAGGTLKMSTFTGGDVK